MDPRKAKIIIHSRFSSTDENLFGSYFSRFSALFTVFATKHKSFWLLFMKLLSQNDFSIRNGRRGTGGGCVAVVWVGAQHKFCL